MTSNDEDQLPLPEGWTRCHAYLKGKRRYCRQLRQPASNYCGNHQELDDPSTNLESTPKRKRIPCPLDKSHTIFEDMLSRHLKICPKAKQQQMEESLPYFQRNINAGGHGDMGQTCYKGETIDNADSNNSPAEKKPFDRIEHAKALALRVLAVHQHLFTAAKTKALDAQLLLDDDDVRNVTLSDIESALPLNDLSSQELALGLEDSIQSYRIRSGGPKHVQQQASLLGHMRRLSMSKTSSDSKRNNDINNSNNNIKEYVFLELGAGRGMLGLIAGAAFAASGSNNLVDLIMIERSSTRSKAEKILRNKSSTLEGRCIKVEEIRDWQRIQCDLAHLHMPTVLERRSSSSSNNNNNSNNSAPANKRYKRQPTEKSSQEKPVLLAVAKHLCGAGTDLALKALHPIRDQLDVCIMATCCHGLCTWSDYVGRDYLREVMDAKQPTSNADENSKNINKTPFSSFGQREFDLLRNWSSGTVKDVSCATKYTTTKKVIDQERSVKKQNDEQDEDTHYNPDPKFEEPSDLVSVTMVAKQLSLRCGEQGLGRACQRLIDYGRLVYLQRCLFVGDGDHSFEDMTVESELCYYVPSCITPQNAVLMAARKNRG